MKLRPMTIDCHRKLLLLWVGWCCFSCGSFLVVGVLQRCSSGSFVLKFNCAMFATRTLAVQVWNRSCCFDLCGGVVAVLLKHGIATGGNRLPKEIFYYCESFGVVLIVGRFLLLGCFKGVHQDRLF